MSHEKNDFWMRERECERSFVKGGPYFFITTENLDWMLYENDEEFIVGTNMVAISAAKSGLIILDDVQMNNHHHFMGSGAYEVACLFADELHLAERKFQRKVRNRSLKKWDIRIDPITDLKQFRSLIVYIDRNAYVARRDSMPTGYPWGSASMFFNQNLRFRNPGTRFCELGGREKRIICRSHQVDLPYHYRVLNGMILRDSFVNYKKTESLFNNANQYFSMLSKRGEADIEIAAMLGESIQIPHEEVFQIVSGWFPGYKIRELDKKTAYEAAKMMKYRLKSSNRQIVQILNLTTEEVNRMFPIPV